MAKTRFAHDRFHGGRTLLQVILLGGSAWRLCCSPTSLAEAQSREATTPAQEAETPTSVSETPTSASQNPTPDAPLPNADQLKQRVQQAVAQLDDADAGQRDAAERQLSDWLAQTRVGEVDAFLSLLPRETPQMSAETRMRLQRVRRVVQDATASRAGAATRLTLDLKEASIGAALQEIERQTGNRLVDLREQFGQPTREKKVTLQVADVPFWQGVDELLDLSDMAPYPTSGEEGLGLVNRESNAIRRSGKASYAGPFRIEGTAILAHRNLRAPEQSQLRLELEVSWEPRLRPLSVAQSASDVHVVVGEGLELPLTNLDRRTFELEIQPGSHASELALPFQLPARSDVAVESVRGKLDVILPAQMAEFAFANLAKNQREEQTIGGVRVVLERVRNLESLWEVHMRLTLEKGDVPLDRYRSWALNNLSTLRSGSGEILDNAGFETTVQTAHEMGCAYFFELPAEESIDNYSWIYRAPASLVTTSVEYELKQLPLP